jgi:chromosome segregation ATPase
MTITESENANYKTRLEKLAALLREREKKITELHQYEISFRKVSEQKSMYDSIVEKHLERIHALEGKLEDSSLKAQASCQQIEQLQATIESMRQQYESNQDELKALQSQFDPLKRNIDDAKKELEVATRKQNELESFLQVTESTSLDDVRIKLAALKEQLQIAEEAAADKQTVQSERDSLQEALLQVKNAQEDSEARLKIAHQHLAKKVKEAAMLNDNVQSHQEQLLELQAQFNQARLKIAEMQQTLDAHVQQEGRLQEQIQQSSRSMEALTSRWEEKYFKIYEKWQEGEVRIREMKKLEEKYSQMQSLLSNISGVFGMPVGNAAVVPQAPPPSFIDMTVLPAAEPVITAHMSAMPVCEEEPASTGFYGQLAQPHLHNDANDMMLAAQTLEDMKTNPDEKLVKASYQSLFDMPQQVKRSKNTLFD